MDLVQRLKLLSVLSSCCSQLHIQTVVLVRPAAEGNTWNMCSDVKCACHWGRVNRAGTRHKWEICLLITISEWISAAQQNIWTWTLTTFMLIKWIRTKLEVSVQNHRAESLNMSQIPNCIFHSHVTVGVLKTRITSSLSEPLCVSVLQCTRRTDGPSEVCCLSSG